MIVTVSTGRCLWCGWGLAAVLAKLRARVMFAVLILLSALQVGGASAAPPVDVYGALPAVQRVTLSPSGKYFAVVQSDGGQSVLTTYEAASRSLVGATAAGQGQVIAGLIWHSDDRVIVFVVESKDVAQDSYIAFPNNSHPHGIDRHADFAYANSCHAVAVNRDGTHPVFLTRNGRQAGCALLSVRGPQSDTVLVLGRTEEGWSSTGVIARRAEWTVFSLNVNNGLLRRFEQDSRTSSSAWVADPQGRVRMRIDREAGLLVARARLSGSSAWIDVHAEPAEREKGDTGGGMVQFLGFGAAADQVYVSRNAGDRREIGVFDLQSRRFAGVSASDGKYDAGHPIALRDGRIVGANINRAVPEQIFFSDDWRRLQSVLIGSYPNHQVLVVSSSDDLRRHAVYVEGPEFPSGVYQLVDMDTSEATTIGRAYPALGKGAVSDVKKISYAARDGLQLDAYLTLPFGRPPAKLAAVVLPHGGPAARDTGGFDWLSQFFASRGYAVLQPQYRGSDGFGAKFRRAGEKQWGRKMQDDLSDGVRYLVSSGVADPDRVCIVGWSYGGYAALAGLTLTPQLYRCGIAGASPSDLVEFQLWISKYGGWKSGASAYWRDHMGDVNAERDQLQAVSPAKHVKNVRAPLLLIHGEADGVVPIRQSEIVAEALSALGKPYEFVRLPGEHHNLSFASTRTKMLRAAETFILKHNPPN